MVSTQLLSLDDLRRWRACERQFWLHRQRGPQASAVPLPAPAAADSDDSAEASVVHGPAIHAALRASFPHATLAVIVFHV